MLKNNILKNKDADMPKTKPVPSKWSVLTGRLFLILTLAGYIAVLF